MTTKKVTKKTTSKKTAKKKAQNKSFIQKSVSEIGGLEFSKLMRESLESQEDLKKNKILSFTPREMMSRDVLPLCSLDWQYAIASKGFPLRSWNDLTAVGGKGKSSLLFRWAGDWMRLKGAAICYIECEGKPPTEDWIKRLLSRSKVEADDFYEKITFLSARTQYEAANKAELWAKALREIYPINFPGVVFFDTYSKLLADSEAAGVSNYGKHAGAKSMQIKEVGDYKVGDHATFNHSFARRIPSLADKYNLTFFAAHHQTEKIGSTGMGGAAFNNTKIGGVAFDTLAATQIILTYQGLVKDTQGNPIGKTLSARIEKNLGPTGARVPFNIIDRGQDTADTYYDGVDFSTHCARFMADNKILGTTVSQARFSCEDIGARSLNHKDFMEKFYSQRELVEHVGRSLNIRGYKDIDDVVKEVKEELNDQDKQ